MSNFEDELQDLFADKQVNNFREKLRTDLADDVSGMEYVGDVAQGIFAGAVDAVDETLNFARNFVGAEKGRILPEVDLPVTGVGQASDDISQFIVGMVGAGKITNTIKGVRLMKEASTKGRIAKAAVDSAISSTVAHNPYDERLADIIQRYPSLQNPVTEYLQGQTDDSEFELRAKMALEDVVANGAITAILGTLVKATGKGYKAIKGDGKVDEAVEAEIQQAGKKLDEAAPAAKAEAEESVKASIKGGKDEAKPLQSNEKAAKPKAKAKATPKKEVEAPATPKVTAKQAKELVKTLRTVKGDEKSFDELQDGVDNFLYNIIQTRKQAGQAEHISLYDDMDAFYTSIGRQVFDLTADAQKATKRTETFEQLQERAAAQLMDTADMTADEVSLFLAKHADNTRDAYTFLAATDAMIRKQYDELLNLANVADEAFDDTVRLSLLAEFEKLQRLLQGATGVRSEMGRALKSRQMGIKSYAELGRLAKAAADDPDQLRTLVRNSDAKDLVKKAKLMDNKRIAGPLGEFFRSMILFNYKTQVTNALSGVVETFLVPTERIMGSLFVRGAEGAAVRSDATAQLVGLKQATNDALHYAAAAFKEERNILDPLRTTTENTQHKISSQYLGVETDSTLGRFVDFIGKSSRLSLRALGSSDEFLKQMNYRSFMKAKAAREGVEQGLKGADLDAYIVKRMDESFDSAGRGVDKEALEYSQRITFTEDLGNNFFGDLQKLSVKYPAMQLVLPFIRTPTNLLKRAGQRTPALALISKSVRDDIAAGGVRRAEALGRQAMGAVFMTSMFFAFGEGKITGAGPTDPKARRFLRNTGWQPYSVKIGDNYYSYNRLDPNFIAIGAAATAFEAMSPVLEDADAETQEMIGEVSSALFLGVTQTFKNKAYFQGLSNLLTALSAEDERALKRIGNIGSNSLASFIPSALTQTTDVLQGQEALTEAIGLSDKLKKKIPVLKDSLPKKYNWVTGQTIDYPVIANTLGFQKSEVPNTNVMEELRAIGYGFTGPEKRISKQDLTSEQFSDYSRLTGTLKINGKTLEQSLSDLFASSQWKSAAEERKRFRQNGQITTVEIQTVSGIIGGYKRAAREALLKKYPDLKQAIIDYKKMRKGTDLLQANR